MTKLTSNHCLYVIYQGRGLRLPLSPSGHHQGGLAVVAPLGVGLKRLETGVRPTLFELLCVRVVSGSFSCVVVLIYRPPKVKKEAETDQTAMSGFFVELGDVLDRVVTSVDPLYIVGDINIHLERPDEPVSRQFVELLGSHGLAFPCFVADTRPWRDAGCGGIQR